MTRSQESELFERALVLYDEGKFKEGYTLITEHAHEVPDSMPKAFFVRLCLIAKTGDLPLAEEILEDALDQGYFYSEKTLRTEADLADLQGREFYERLVARNRTMLEQAQKNSRPFLQLIQPGESKRSTKPPFVMALHGNSSNLKHFQPEWSFISQTEWLAALPQSSQLGGAGIYVWDDQPTALQELTAHYQSVARRHDLDLAHSLISGFSMGGQTALRAALEQSFPITAFLVICPWFGPSEPWVPMIQAAAEKHLKGYFVLGELDNRVNLNARDMQSLLDEKGIPSIVEVIPGIRHEMPPEFEQVFHRAVHFLFPDLE
jgi:predicted esterase